MMALDKLAKPWKSDTAYQEYVIRQAEKTQRFRDHIAGPRVSELVGLLVRTIHPVSPIGLSALAIGCRNVHELNVLQGAGFGPLSGIDLLSMSPRIQAMDMHALTFADQSFDVIFSAHSLEHAYDADRALAEFARVTRPRGYWAIEVPLRFDPTAVDRNDFQSTDALADRCEALGMTTILKQMNEQRTAGRVILQK